MYSGREAYKDMYAPNCLLTSFQRQVAYYVQFVTSQVAQTAINNLLPTPSQSSSTKSRSSIPD